MHGALGHEHALLQQITVLLLLVLDNVSLLHAFLYIMPTLDRGE